MPPIATSSLILRFYSSNPAPLLRWSDALHELVLQDQRVAEAARLEPRARGILMGSAADVPHVADHGVEGR
eukprot:10663294-Heterocapsa_arctica.AAC.1